ncbi:MAG: GNAT family N-acetyltransferase [Candidatus Eisenbacteria bacterium]|nr:GNAT family N-acetyltransferase [Candidatus Eisenbacteria bacterium]
MSLGDTVASGRIDSRAVTVALGREDDRSFLVSLEGPRCVGRLRGRFLNPRLYFVEELTVADSAGADEVADSLAAFLADSFCEDGTEILAWDRPEARPVNRALESAGFVVGRSKVFVERDIADYASPYDDPLEYRSLASLGDERFLEIMTEASRGDPFEDMSERDPRADFRELRDYAGRKFDPTWWRVAFRGGTPVGVILPQEFADRDGEGTLFYVGVVPSERGHGYGKMLHATGLSFLSRKGITRYAGSTDTRNSPMLRVFEANGCRITGTQLFYKALKKNLRKG